MKNTHEDTGRVIAVAIAAWGAVASLAHMEGAFAAFEGSSIAVFAALISLYAVAAFRIDLGLRDYASRAAPAAVRAIAAATALLLGLALAWKSAPLAIFAAPLAAMALAAALDSFRARPRSASSAKSPGAKPAAT